jgi:hypothetical protein
MLFTAIITGDCENITKPINTVCKEIAGTMKCKAVGAACGSH